jgi:plasmid maintenance system antidote protein VapI
LPQLTKPFSTCKEFLENLQNNIQIRTQKEGRKEGRESGSMAYSQQNQKEGLQKRREAKP